MHLNRLVFGITFFLSFIVFDALGQAPAKTDTSYIFLRDYGMYRTKKKNCVKYIREVQKDLKGKHPKKLIFSTGTYHFYPDGAVLKEYYESNTTDINPRICALHFEGIENLIIDGRGSTLIFHEQMQPFTFDSCSNLILKNVTIDWDNPLIAQAEVLKVTDHYIDLGIDPRESPYAIENDKLFFTINRDKKNAWKGTMEFDRKGHYVVPQTGDRGCLGRNWREYRVQAVLPGTIRLYNEFLRKPKVGNFLVLRHAERIHSGVFITESNNIRIDNLRLYHATGLGILAQFSENLTFHNYKAIPNKTKARYFGGGDDGLQVSNCKGQITVSNCEFAGLMDDPINVHGTSVQIQEIVSATELKCKFMHHQSVGLNWGHVGDKISFIENKKMNSLGTGHVASFKPIDKEYFLLAFSEPIPGNIEVGDALENLTWSPDLFVKDSHFKSSRARGLLVSTPGKVVIENNIFESSGSAILIAGDANGWFESGAVTDVLIRNNTFTELCNTSSYQFCEGIISIFPIIPEPDEELTFHRNIRIENNHFYPFDYPILFARSVDTISFTNNTVTRSYNFSPYHNRRHSFSFEFCKNARIEGNLFSEDLLGKNILLKNTKRNNLQTDLEDSFQIEQFVAE